MITEQEYQDTRKCTENISKITNNLAFAGIAIIWLFINKENSPIPATMPLILFLALMAFVLTIFLGIFQLICELLNYESKKEIFKKVNHALFKVKIIPLLFGFILTALYLFSNTSIIH